MKKNAKLAVSDLVKAISEERDIPKEHVSAVLSAFKVITREVMKKDGVVDLGRDFGKFVTIKTAARNRTSPHTKEQIAIGPKTRMRFRPSLSLREIT